MRKSISSKWPIIIGCFLGASCSKKEDAAPNNTIKLVIDGKAESFDPAMTTVTISDKGRTWFLRASKQDKTGTLTIGISSNQNTEATHTYTAASNISEDVSSEYHLLITDYLSPCNGLTAGTQGYTFYTRGQSYQDLRVEIKSIDKASHTISGVFNGTYYKGCDSKKITEGQFNLPYTVNP